MNILTDETIMKFRNISNRVQQIFVEEKLTLFEGKLVLALARDQILHQNTSTLITEDLAKRGVLAKVN